MNHQYVNQPNRPTETESKASTLNITEQNKLKSLTGLPQKNSAKVLYVQLPESVFDIYKLGFYLKKHSPNCEIYGCTQKENVEKLQSLQHISKFFTKILSL